MKIPNWICPNHRWKIALILFLHRFNFSVKKSIEFFRIKEKLKIRFSKWADDATVPAQLVCSKIPPSDGFPFSLCSETKLINWKAVNVPRSLSENVWLCQPKRMWRICFYSRDEPRMTLSLNCWAKMLDVVINCASMSPQRRCQPSCACHFVVAAQSSFQLMRHKSCLFFFSFLFFGSMGDASCASSAHTHTKSLRIRNPG